MNFRSDFALFQQQPALVYLDSASSCQVPEAVVGAMSDYLRGQHANVHRGNYRLSQEATERYELARQRLADFLATTAQQVVMTHGTTDGLNRLAAGLAERVNRGDNVVVSLAEHHANLLPWQRLCQQRGAELRVLPLDSHGRVVASTELIDAQTKVVAVTHASNVLGVVNPLAEVTKLARQVGAFVVIDAAQTAAHLPLAPDSMNIDALVFSAHKVYGPTGVGALWMSPELAATLPLYQVGGGIVTQVTTQHSEYVSGIQRFEPGTPNLVGIAGFMAALDYLEQVRAQGSADYLQGLMAELFAMLKACPWLRVLPHGDGQVPVVSVTSDDPDMHPNDIAMLLNQQDIAVRSGHHCAQPLMQSLSRQGGLRFSLGVYNQTTDIQRLHEGLSKALDLLS